MLDQLRADFPDVTISKIRFLEAEGLVEPERTPSGYRKFCHRRRRAAALRPARAARPLPAAEGDREHLDAIDRGLEPPPIGAGVAHGCPTWRSPADGLPDRRVVRRDASELRLSRARAARGGRASPRTLLDAAREYGLVTPRAGAGHYDGDALVIATTARELAGFGLEPRHLRAFRTAADREVGLVEQVVAPLRSAARRRRPGARRGGRPRAGRAVGAAARDAGQGRARARPDAPADRLPAARAVRE